nr:Uncharacterised protein [Klebsiella pneumoniae]
MRDLQTFKLKFDWVLTEARLRDILQYAGSFCLFVLSSSFAIIPFEVYSTM